MGQLPFPELIANKWSQTSYPPLESLTPRLVTLKEPPIYLLAYLETQLQTEARSYILGRQGGVRVGNGRKRGELQPPCVADPLPGWCADAGH